MMGTGASGTEGSRSFRNGLTSISSSFSSHDQSARRLRYCMATDDGPSSSARSTR